MMQLRTYLLAGCLVANLGVVAFAQDSTSTSASSSTQQTTTKKQGKHCWRKHCHLKKLFKKSSKTESTTTK